MLRGLRSFNSTTTHVVQGLSKQIGKKKNINVFANIIRNNNVPLLSAIRFYSSSNMVSNIDNSNSNNVDKITDMIPQIGDFPIVDSSSNILEVANTIVESEFVLGNGPSHLVMKLVENIHIMGDMPYWQAIITTTCVLRFLMLPLGIKTAQSGARMAAMRPDMDKLQKAMTADPLKDDMRIKQKYQEQMKALFKKYKVNPLHSIAMPFIQFPVFISFFAALREMGNYFPGYSSGGMNWFTDLSVADPTMILPICNALSFLLMIEIGVDGMAKEQQGQFVWVMRGLGVAMVPLTMDMPMGLFIYWNANNLLSILQAGVMKQEGVRTFLDIPKPPVDAPALKMRNPFSTIIDGIKKEKAQSENVRAEIIDGSMPPPPPPSGAIPVTFATPPKKKVINKPFNNSN